MAKFNFSTCLQVASGSFPIHPSSTPLKPCLLPDGSVMTP